MKQGNIKKENKHKTATTKHTKACEVMGHAKASLSHKDTLSATMKLRPALLLVLPGWVPRASDSVRAKEGCNACVMQGPKH